MKSEKCRNCIFYSAYYKQGINLYERLNHGFCTKKNTMQVQFETCDNFKTNEIKEKCKQEKMFYYLEMALESINTIAQILKEKSNSEEI